MIRKIFFNLIRPFFVWDIDPNDDYVCVNCGRSVLTRNLFCKNKCYQEFKLKAPELFE